MLRHRSATGWHRAIRSVALLLLAGFASAAGLSPVTLAQSAPTVQAAHDPHGTHIAEAARRFRIPERWIRAVMQVESSGRMRAVSSAGAMGLMQIMPDTWAGLRIRHRLGRDPFNPRDNILGGTAYLREMYDRFGSPGFLAAYNVGPERYRQHLATGRPLPRETRAYMAMLLPMLGLGARAGATTVARPPSDWREAPLFVDRSDGKSGADPAQEKRRPEDGSATRPMQYDREPVAPPEAVFVAQSRMDERP